MNSQLVDCGGFTITETDVVRCYWKRPKLLDTYLRLKAESRWSVASTIILVDGRRECAKEHTYFLTQSIGALAKRLEIAKSTLHEYLIVLERDGFLTRDVRTISTLPAEYDNPTILFRSALRTESGKYLTRTLPGRLELDFPDTVTHHALLGNQEVAPTGVGMSGRSVEKNPDVVLVSFLRKYKANSYIGRRLGALSGSSEPERREQGRNDRRMIVNILYEGWTPEEVDQALQYLELRGIGPNQEKPLEPLSYLLRNFKAVLDECRQWSNTKNQQPASQGGRRYAPRKGKSGVQELIALATKPMPIIEISPESSPIS